jgi:putative transposase
VVKRCQIIVQSAEGKSDKTIARQLGINRHTCRLWRERFVRSGVDSLWEIEPGRGRKVQVGLAQRIIEATLHTKPKGQTHWSTRELAKEQGVHPSTVARIWQEHELKPHRQKSFKTLTGCEVRPKAARCSRDLSESSSARRCALCR